jgi:predicted ATPase
LIYNRLRRLTPEARDTLETAAIIGGEFMPEVISAVNKKSLAEIRVCLDELEKQVLVEQIVDSPLPYRYRFIHDKFRESILSELSPQRATYLHRHVAFTLVANPGIKLERQAAVIAQHFESGDELVKAFHFWLEAGDHARQLSSAKDAERIFKHAESLIDLAGEQLSDDLIYRLYSTWTQVAFAIEDSESIQTQNTNLLELGRRRKSPMLIGTALDGLGDACLARSEFERGLEFAAQAVEYLEKSHNLYEQIDAYNHKGVFLNMLGRIPEAVEAFREALALGTSSEDPGLAPARAASHFQIALSRTLQGWPESGRDHSLLSLKEASVQSALPPARLT